MRRQCIRTVQWRRSTPRTRQGNISLPAPSRLCVVARCIGMQNSRFFSPLGLSLGRVGGIGVRYTPPRLVED